MGIPRCWVVVLDGSLLSIVFEPARCVPVPSCLIQADARVGFCRRCLVHSATDRARVVREARCVTLHTDEYLSARSWCQILSACIDRVAQNLEAVRPTYSCSV
ncbi:hypothetical protein FB451DRAFT_465566 [Mycena latifolia]|nr:hypothetical protein FB451DRAFT_465566 [Mycena latifolia]